MGQSGWDDDGVSGAEDRAFALDAVAEAAGQHIGALRMGVGVHRTDRAGFKGDLDRHQLFVVGQHPAPDAAAKVSKGISWFRAI